METKSIYSKENNIQSCRRVRTAFSCAPIQKPNIAFQPTRARRLLRVIKFGAGRGRLNAGVMHRNINA